MDIVWFVAGFMIMNCLLMGIFWDAVKRLCKKTAQRPDKIGERPRGSVSERLPFGRLAPEARAMFARMRTFQKEVLRNAESPFSKEKPMQTITLADLKKQIAPGWRVRVRNEQGQERKKTRLAVSSVFRSSINTDETMITFDSVVPDSWSGIFAAQRAKGQPWMKVVLPAKGAEPIYRPTRYCLECGQCVPLEKICEIRLVEPEGGAVLKDGLCVACAAKMCKAAALLFGRRVSWKIINS